MKYSIVLLFSLLLFSCSDSQLKADNVELKTQVEQLRLLAEKEAANSREAEARAMLAQQQAEQAMAMARAAEVNAVTAMTKAEENRRMALAAQREAEKQAIEASKQMEISKQ
ncbi:MAG: hypothetical protein RIF46_10300, partial [Cyclobacteriaceae bacterium]